MRLLFIICIGLLISSCRSADYHYRKAIKKDPSIVKNDTTTIIKYQPAISGETISLDTAVVENDIVSIKAFELNSSIVIQWLIKESTDTSSIVSNVIEAPKTRKEIRTDSKIKKRSNKVENKIRKKDSKSNRRLNSKVKKMMYKYMYKVKKLENKKIPTWVSVLASFGGICVTLLLIIIFLKLKKWLY